MLALRVACQSSASVQKTSVLVLTGTGTVRVWAKTLAMVSQRYWLMEPFSAEVMFRFTTMTPPGFRWRWTSWKNSWLESWKGMVMSW